MAYAGFFIFVYWKFAVHGQHNLHPCTGFLFPVNSRIYFSLYTVSFFTCKWTAHIRWSFLCTGILQHICRNSDVHSGYCGYIVNYNFFIISYLCVIWPTGQSVGVPCNKPEFMTNPVCFCYFSFYRIFPVNGLQNSGSFQSCTSPEFCSLFTVKTAPEKKRPYTF